MHYVISIVLFFISTSVVAHQSSNSYLAITVEQQQFNLRWDIALRDLQNVINLDINRDKEIQWQEVQEKQLDIFAHALARLDIQANSQACSLVPNNLLINQRSDGFYAVLYAQGTCADIIKNLNLTYQLFFEIDSQHRGLLKITHVNDDISFAFSPQTNQKQFEFHRKDNLNVFLHFISQGIWHIWIGYDHMLFLLSLLLPAVLFRNQNNWCAVSSFPKTMSEVVKIVTAFTIAHSITLSLVILNKISLPVTLVESCIALSVIIAALNNLYPVISHKRWLLGFIFGLIHGFGFANVMSELELSQHSLFLTLSGFNVGVELGQLLIVLIVIPLAFLLRKSWLYQTIIFKLGSATIASMGVFWMMDRTL